MKSHPLVSVNIRTFNSAKTLNETLKSVKGQTYPNIEILVSDGFSTDDSVDIAKKYKASVRMVDKLGDARFQNYQDSKGKYIISLDSDQILDAKVIERCVELCERDGFDAVTISEKSIVDKNTLLQKLIAYDKWVIDQAQDADATFGTACPRFFRKSVFSHLKWPLGLSVFDDTILYAEILKNGARVIYLRNDSIRHYEVSDWGIFAKKFFRYGKGYVRALQVEPATIAAHSLPRKSYFSKVAFAKPDYFVGLLFLYLVKATAATLGMLSSVIEGFIFPNKNR